MVEHDADGVVIEKPANDDAAPTKRTRRVLSSEEKAERDRVQAERADLRRRELAAFEALIPSLHTEGEPALEHGRPITLDARTAAGETIAVVKRANGSELRVTAKRYDGFNGGRPKRYVHTSVWFNGVGGLRFRSKGTGIEGLDEARALRDALSTWITAREAEDAVSADLPDRDVGEEGDGRNE